MPSITVENYLKQVYQAQQKLASEQDLVPVGRVAAAMKVTPGTGTTMVKTLAEAGLLYYEPRGGVRLTEAGSKLALQVLRRHRLVELFLVQVLGLDWSEVHEEAEELEHAISDKVLERIDHLLGHPDTDPHGDPIPPRHGGDLPAVELASLADCPTNEPLRIVRVVDQDPAFLQYIDKQGLTPGTAISVDERQQSAEAVTVRTPEPDTPPVTLGTTAAAKILVQPR